MRGPASLLVLYDLAIVLFSRVSLSANVSNLLSCHALSPYCWLTFTSVSYKLVSVVHCKNAKVVLTQFGYITFLLIVCIIKHSEVQLPALDSKQIKNLIWFSRSLVNVMGE